jgi:hypothetical protein
VVWLAKLCFSYDALRDGLEWGGGVLEPFALAYKAAEYFCCHVNAGHVVRTESPGFFE